MVLRAYRCIAGWIDAADLGGWLCLAAGAIIVSATVLAPAWLDVQHLRREYALLRYEAVRIEAQRENYDAFIAAIEANQPMLLQRLAWHHLGLKPSDGELWPQTHPVMSTANGNEQAWIESTPVIAAEIPRIAPVPESRLVRMVLGAPRPWVLVFGGWLILLGLLTQPRLTHRTPTDR